MVDAIAGPSASVLVFQHSGKQHAQNPPGGKTQHECREDSAQAARFESGVRSVGLDDPFDIGLLAAGFVRASSSEVMALANWRSANWLSSCRR
jgi:hypothetical protein